MGSRRQERKRRQQAEAARSRPSPEPSPLAGKAAAPFHNPFRELAGSLKPAAARKAATPAPPVPTPAAPAAAAAPPAMSDEEALAASLRGVSPIAPAPSRVRLRRKADPLHVLEHIEAKRREDIAAMSRGEGFDITHDDQYVRARASGVSLETLSRLEKGDFPISAHLDLHRLPLEEARHAVDEFLAAQQKQGHRCVLLITGKGKNSFGGEGVLRKQVPEWLARGPSARRVLAFASARPCDGGLGALVVLMRSGSSSKHRIDVERGGVGPARG